jgi:hypothetical protein
MWLCYESLWELEGELVRRPFCCFWQHVAVEAQTVLLKTAHSTLKLNKQVEYHPGKGFR